jgi:hypothetical protein
MVDFDGGARSVKGKPLLACFFQHGSIIRKTKPFPSRRDD